MAKNRPSTWRDVPSVVAVVTEWQRICRQARKMPLRQPSDEVLRKAFAKHPLFWVSLDELREMLALWCSPLNSRSKIEDGSQVIILLVVQMNANRIHDWLPVYAEKCPELLLESVRALIGRAEVTRLQVSKPRQESLLHGEHRESALELQGQLSELSTRVVEQLQTWPDLRPEEEALKRLFDFRNLILQEKLVRYLPRANRLLKNWYYFGTDISRDVVRMRSYLGHYLALKGEGWALVHQYLIKILARDLHPSPSEEVSDLWLEEVQKAVRSKLTYLLLHVMATTVLLCDIGKFSVSKESQQDRRVQEFFKNSPVFLCKSVPDLLRGDKGELLTCFSWETLGNGQQLVVGTYSKVPTYLRQAMELVDSLRDLHVAISQSPAIAD